MSDLGRFIAIEAARMLVGYLVVILVLLGVGGNVLVGSIVYWIVGLLLLAVRIRRLKSEETR